MIEKLYFFCYHVKPVLKFQYALNDDIGKKITNPCIKAKN